MYLHELKSALGSRKRRKIVGRGPGSGHGKTSTRGQKGQGARKGRGILLGLEGGQMPMIRRIAKVGFNSKRPVVYELVKLQDLNRFQEGAVVDAEFLKSKGLIRSVYKPFKVLGDGEIKKALKVYAYSFSKTAEEKINKAGGKTFVITKDSLKKDESAKKSTK